MAYNSVQELPDLQPNATHEPGRNTNIQITGYMPDDTIGGVTLAYFMLSAVFYVTHICLRPNDAHDNTTLTYFMPSDS